MKLLFNEELLGVLRPEELVFIFLYIEGIEYSDADFEGSHVYDKLCDYYLEEMPYGTAKARTGDPLIWIRDRLISIS